MADIVLPTSAALKLVEQTKLPLLTQDDPSFKLFPIVSEDTDTLMWEQMDNFTGVTHIRGLNGQPGRVKAVGMKRFQAEIGVYGDFEEIDEYEMTRRRQLGTFGDAISFNELVSLKQDLLLGRYIDRMRLMIWTMLSSGVYTATNISGSIIHTDQYPLQTASASVAWATVATAVPLADMRALKLKARGYSTRFDASATAYMNQTTANYLLNNANAADLFGRRMDVGGTFNSLGDMNKVFLANDLPQVEVYDETYFAETAPTTPVLFIPDNKVVVVGNRKNGAPIGDICQTRNANNPNFEPGSYTLITDSANASMNVVPRIIRLDRGFNGGLRIYYPTSVVVLSV